ncbi:SusC/RagA family TonB-linked outer membrane protein [Sabulilitoribacter arenilitoris]|uniref:SusC/RagA family TonB-linked outer membrane protein n=1 Tax=Wocania arenilitoris TaxID=2044858 RepID=A0AAE3EM41_9FLAO|nr:SusC/RagA family TonB-linked outer membrane protein [Wocania arenilitoris]MCF7567506.1 SusC/RagA family TonB-linked outer membrane protein [Wocania arenilitoris]
MKTKFSGMLTLLLAFVVQFSFAQEKTISGTVSDETGLPLPGTTVLVKGTSSGTSTDFDGNYSIDASTGDILVFSFVGYTSQEITVGSSNTINVTMQEDAAVLEEVVVTAQGIRREKKALGYAVTTLDSEQVESRPEADIARVLSGKVAGVNVVGTGGLAGSGTNIIIRGPGSITQNNQPLFVVNGVPFSSSTNAESNVTTGNGSVSASSRFLDLDPNNIESMSVLKGLSATALYGEQGRNGVILITTKTGSTANIDKGFEITVNQSTFFSKISNLPDYQNTYGQGGDNSTNVGFVGTWGGRFDSNTMVRHHYNVGRLAASFPEFQGVNVLYQPFKDNVKDFFNTGIGYTTSLNASKSSENVSYNINFGRTREDGFVPGNSFDRLNFGLGGNIKLSNKFSVSGSFNYVNSGFKTPPVAANSGTGNFSIFERTMFIPRSFDLNGLPYQDPITGASVYYRTDQENPLWLVANSQESIDVDRFYNSVSTTFDISDIYSLTYRLGYDTYTEKQQFYMNKGGVASIQANQGFLKTTSGTNRIWDHSILFNINGEQITDNISLNGTIGLNSNSESFEKFGIFSQNQLVFGLIDHNNFVSQSNVDPFGSELDFMQKVNRLGIFGQLEFGYEDYLYLTVAGRNDWISTVESANRSLFYPSASISFIPTAAIDGLKSDGLNYLKFRFGFGSSAGFPGPYNTRGAFSLSTAALTTGGGVPINTISPSTVAPNPDLKPELHEELEAGIEARFWRNRISLEASVYKRNSEDQIVAVNLASSSGSRTSVQNLGELETKGIEIDLGISPFKGNDGKFQWDSNYSFTAFENEVITTDGNGNELFIAGFSNLGNYAIEGQPLGVIRGSYAVRDDNGNYMINPTTGNIIDSDAIGLDNAVIGDPNPDWKLTTINTFRYGNLSLSAQVEYTHGGDFSSNTIDNLLRRGVTKDTDQREGTLVVPGFLANPSTGEPLVDGNGNQIPNNIQLGANEIYFLNFLDPAGQAIYDGSVVRLREISLSYDLPNKLLEKTPFGSLSFTVLGNNLWYWAPNVPEHTNFDPEVISTGVGNGQGLEFQTAPTSKKFSFSIKATF